MRYDDENPFDTDNRAYQRFLAVAGDHFDVLTWQREADDRPVLTTLTDLASGDMFTLAIMDSLEVRDPHALLAFTTGAELSAYGPFAGPTAAATHAATVALDATMLAATRPIPLHHPDQPTLPAQGWLAVPDTFADAARPAIADAPTVALVLLDRPGRRLAAVGPFTRGDNATAWNPDPGTGPHVDRLVVPLHPVTPADRP